MRLLTPIIALLLVASMIVPFVMTDNAQAAYTEGVGSWGTLGTNGKWFTLDGVNQNNSQLKLVGQVETTAIAFSIMGYLEGQTDYQGKCSHLYGPDTGSDNKIPNCEDSYEFFDQYFAISKSLGMNFIRIGPGDSWGSEYMYHYQQNHQTAFYSLLHNMTAAAEAHEVWLCFVLAGSQAYGGTYPYSYQYGGTGTVFDKNSTAYANYKEYCLAMIEEFENDTAVGMFDMFNEPDHDNIHQNYWHTHGDDDAFAAWAADIASWACPATDVPVGMGVAYIGAMWSWGSSTFAKAQGNWAFDVANFHMYGYATDNNNINLITGWAADNNKPVYLSEVANNQYYPIQRWAIQENHLFNVTTTGVAAGPMVLTGTPDYPWTQGHITSWHNIQEFLGWINKAPEQYAWHPIQEFLGWINKLPKGYPGGGGGIKIIPGSIDVSKLVQSIIYLAIFFLPGMVLNLKLPRLGMLSGIAVMTILFMILDPSFVAYAILVYICIAVLLIRGDWD
jgi:hypothetical protein